MDKAKLDELRKRGPYGLAWYGPPLDDDPKRNALCLTCAERDALFAYIDELLEKIDYLDGEVLAAQERD